MADAKWSTITPKATAVAADQTLIIDSVGGASKLVSLDDFPLTLALEVRLGAANAPSATELSHVKGVTSLIQTQLGAKVDESVLAAKGDLLTASAAATPAVITDVATGQVLISGGVGELPSWNANPPVNSLNAGDNIAVGTSSSHTGEILLKNATNTNILTVKPGTTAADFSLTLPTAVPAGENYLLKASTTGVLAYTDPSTLGSAPTAADDVADTTLYPLLASDATGAITFKTTASKLSFNASTGMLTATGLTGPLTGAASSNILTTAKGAASGVASLNGSTLVVENPANATATPTAGKIPIADGSGKLDGWITTGVGSLPVASATGNDTITATYSPAITLTAGTTVRLIAAGANTTAVTFAPNSLTAKPVKKYVSTALVAGDIPAAGYPCDLEYDGTNWILLNPSLETRLGGANAPTAAELAQVKDGAGGFDARLDDIETNFIENPLTAVGDLLTVVSIAPVVHTRIAAPAVGQVLISQGTTTKPIWSATMAANTTGTSASSTSSKDQATNMLQTAADGNSITPTADTKNFVSQTNAQGAGTLTLVNPTGTPVNGQKLQVQIKATSGAQTMAYGNLYAATTDVALPTTVGAGKEILFGFQYNSIDTKWYLVALVNII